MYLCTWFLVIVPDLGKRQCEYLFGGWETSKGKYDYFFDHDAGIHIGCHNSNSNAALWLYHACCLSLWRGKYLLRNNNSKDSTHIQIPWPFLFVLLTWLVLTEVLHMIYRGCEDCCISLNSPAVSSPSINMVLWRSGKELFASGQHHVNSGPSTLP